MLFLSFLLYLFYVLSSKLWDDEENGRGSGSHNGRSPVIRYNRWKNEHTDLSGDRRPLCALYESGLNWVRIRPTFKFPSHSEQAPHSSEFEKSTYIIFPVYFATVTWLCRSGFLNRGPGLGVPPWHTQAGTGTSYYLKSSSFYDFGTPLMSPVLLHGCFKWQSKISIVL
jgi:hypothetical protein